MISPLPLWGGGDPCPPIGQHRPGPTTCRTGPGPPGWRPCPGPSWTDARLPTQPPLTLSLPPLSSHTKCDHPFFIVRYYFWSRYFHLTVSFCVLFCTGRWVRLLLLCVCACPCVFSLQVCVFCRVYGKGVEQPAICSPPLL